MEKEINWDTLEYYQLKECYDIALQFEKLSMAKDILRDKSKAIDIPQGYIPAQENVTLPETEMTIMSEVIQELAREGYTASGNGRISFSYKTNALPLSAEKEYILALLSLRDGTNETYRMTAMQHIGNALSMESEDPRYKALARVLQEVSR